MRRAPYVVGGTAAGLAIVLSFHTAPPSALNVAAGSSASNGPRGTSTTTGPGTARPAAGAPPSPQAATPTTAPSRPASAAAAPAATRTTAPPTTRAPTTTTTAPQTTRYATGQLVYYRYGELQLKVKVTGNTMVDVTTVVDQATDPRSAEINSQAIPQLRDQALQAQSSNIDGVSGATYTSDAYVQSLQSALDQLGWKN